MEAKTKDRFSKIWEFGATLIWIKYGVDKQINKNRKGVPSYNRQPSIT